DLYSLSQVTIGDAVEMLPSLNELTHHSTAEHNTNADHQKEADEHRNTHGDQRAVQGLFCTLEEGGADFCLLGVEVVHCTLEALGTRHTEFVVHEIEGDGVRVLKRLQHWIDSVVDIGTICAHNAGRLTSLLAHADHAFPEGSETVTHRVQLLRSLSDGFTRATADRGVVAFAGFLFIA